MEDKLKDDTQVTESFLELVWVSFMDSDWFMKVIILTSSFVALSLLTGNGKYLFNLIAKLDIFSFVRSIYYSLKKDNDDIESAFDEVFPIPVTKKTHVYKAPEVLNMNPEEEKFITDGVIEKLMDIHRTSKWPTHMVVDLTATEKISEGTKKLFYKIIENVEDGVILHLTIIFALSLNEQMAELKEELSDKQKLSNAKNWEISSVKKNLFMDSRV